MCLYVNILYGLACHTPLGLHVDNKGIFAGTELIKYRNTDCSPHPYTDMFLFVHSDCVGMSPADASALCSHVHLVKIPFLSCVPSNSTCQTSKCSRVGWSL